MIKEKNIQISDKKKDGFEKSKLASIPEDWEIKTLGDLGEFLKGKGVAKKEILDNGIPCIRYGEIYTIHHEYIKAFNSFIDKTSAEESFKLEKGDLLFAGSGEKLEDIGKCVAFLNDFNAYAGGDIVVLRNHQQNAIFMGFLLNTPVFRRQAHKLGQGHSVVHIYSSGLKSVKIPLPPLPEQQKIATILSKWDNAIDKLTQLIAAKELQKKGLMQQLLTGELRFPGFEDEWEEMKLGEVGKVRMCKRVFNSETKAKGDIPFYKISTFGKTADAFISEDLYNKYRAKFSFPNKGDILISAAGTLGKTVVYDGSPAYFQDSNIVWIGHDETVALNSFLYYVYQIIRYDSEGGTVKRLYNSIILNATFLLPTIPEQQKIASMLSATDKEIEILIKELASLQEQKKGLMQQLLTGKIRVKV